MIKRNITAITILLWIFVATSIAWSFESVMPLDREGGDYEKLSVTTGAVVPLGAAKRAAAGGVFITVETNSIRWKIDGGDPTSTDGHLLRAANYHRLHFANSTSLTNLRMIGIGGTATVHVTYYRKTYKHRGD